MGFFQNIFYNKSISRLRLMLESVRMRDFSLQFSLVKLSGEERLLAEEINAVIREFRKTEHRRKGESHFYDALLSNVDSILMATDDTGRVRWMNKAAIDGLCGFRFDTLEHLKVLHPSLPSKLADLRKGTMQLVSFSIPNGEERQYAASMTRIFVSGIGYRLYSMQSVAAILNQGEIQAQQKLIRVLTHEIMNSLTPIVSLSETLAENLTSTDAGNLSSEETNAILSTITRRANGLMEFVQRYRLLSGIAPPVIQSVRVGELMQGLQELSALQFTTECKITFDVMCPDRFVSMDLSQIEHVLINLMKNAVETQATKVSVIASMSDDDRWLVVSILDNGGGFPPEVIDNLFTPFFSTKQGGQGIGLAVCRQIVSNHGGLIGAECVNGGKGARFTMRLPV